MSLPAYIIGIDLGTTNCAVAYVDPALGANTPILDFPIPQLQQPGQVAAMPLLPSSLYLPGEHELPPGSTQLPWGESPGPIVGAFARWQGARVPGRLVVSAKSWLCHPGVDRAAAILPWGATAGILKISPVEASTRLLGHLAAAWDFAHPEAKMAQQEVVITVPASFDEVARALTVQAAKAAGLEKLTLVEEPQAAFYDFTARHRHDLNDALRDIRLVLVVDVGGGTTDFTLIQTGSTADGPALRRIAVGDHLMLGGDNMDATLARKVEERFQAEGRKLSATQWTQLVQASRAAKESLLGANAPERQGISILAEGSRLIRGTLTAELSRSEAETLILDGFFPACTVAEMPRRAARTALQELGLPYAQDPGISRHLAAFLREHAVAGLAALQAEPGGTALPRPDAILFNGGVFNSSQITERLLAVVSAWWPDAPPLRVLPHGSLETAVARGAAAYGLARRGLARRISGGAAHALYIGLAGDKETTAPRAICLIPRGHEEGQSVELKSQPFALVLDRPVQFPLFSTAADRMDRPGDLVGIDDSFRALPPIHTVFKGTGARTGSVPVFLSAGLTELGTLELWCVASTQDERWRLEFELRGTAVSTTATVTESMPARFDEVRAMVQRVFGSQPSSVESREARQLMRALEKSLGPRDTWRLPWLRELWSLLHGGASRRLRSPDHERVFFQLTGYSLRPGFGYPLDEWRCEQTVRLFRDQVKHHTELPVWSEFWVMWRRLAGGLDEIRQKELWDYLKPHLARRIPLAPVRDNFRPKGVQPDGLDEMVRLAASLEHLDLAEKIVLGNWIVPRLKSAETAAGPWVWALGRLGARVPLHGSSHKTVPPEPASAWLTVLLDAGLQRVDGTAFAIVQLARLTGDRTRDLDDPVRALALFALTNAGAPPHWVRLLTEVVAMETEDEARALGDTLPIGLRLK